MPRRDYKSCKHCGRHVDEVGPMSHTRQCFECAEGRLTANAHEIAAQSGPAYERRMVGTIAETLGVNKRVARQLVNAVLHPPAG